MIQGLKVGNRAKLSFLCFLKLFVGDIEANLYGLEHSCSLLPSAIVLNTISHVWIRNLIRHKTVDGDFKPVVEFDLCKQ